MNSKIRISIGILIGVVVLVISWWFLLLKSPEFMCNKKVTVHGTVFTNKGKLDGNHIICSNELSSLKLEFFYPKGEVPCIILASSKNYIEGEKITIDAHVRCTDTRKIPNCDLSSVGCSLLMGLEEV